MSELVQQRWDARLENWALWQLGGVGSRSGSPFPAYRLVRSRHWTDSVSARPCPLVGAAMDTDRLVTRLAGESPKRYDAVRAWYVWTGSLADRAAALGVHQDTLRDRVVAARSRLEELALLRARDMHRAVTCAA